MTKLKLAAIGDAVGVVLPKELMNRLRLNEGDVLYLVENSEGFTLTSHDPEFGEQLEAAKSVMKKYRNALHELAK
ncbi:MAG: AbrB/MazE/SpoVT family DNA-binding domain-containing protein [Candidatus Competibacterales bacterium]